MKFTSVIKGLLLSTVLLSDNSFANNATDDFQYFGYVGYRYLFSSNKIDNTFDSEGIPEIGLNLIYNKDNFQIFNQFRYGTDIDTILVYNFMQYSFNIVDNLNITLKGGKLRHENGLYNTTRIHPVTRQGVIMPQSIYWDAFDEYLASGVGVGFTINYHDFELSYIIDKPTIIDQQQTTRVFYGNFLNSTNSDFGDYQNLSLTYSPLNLPILAKVNWSKLNFGNDTGPLTAMFFPNKVNSDVFGEVLSFGAEYTFDRFVFSGETLWFRSFLIDWTDYDLISKGYSLTTTYNATNNISVRLNYNEYRSGAAKVVHPPKPWIGFYKDINLGVSYHTDNWMFQVEGHHINGSRTLDPLDVQSNPDNYREWWMLGVNVSYSF